MTNSEKREKGDSSDDACVNIFVHKDNGIANNQRVRVELIEVSDDYFSREENLNLSNEVQSDAHFKPVDKASGGKKATGRGKKTASRGKKDSSGGKKPAGRGNRV